MWIGGGVIAVGVLLAMFPGSRRNPIDPVSAPIGIARDDPPPDDGPTAGADDDDRPGDDERELAGVD